MGKIVKYCAACEESFAEKFGFCPNCGQPMTAFEMNPVAVTPSIVEETTAASQPSVEESNVVAPIFRSSAPTFEKSSAAEVVDAPIEEIEADEAEAVAETPIVEDEPKTFAAAAGATNGSGNHQSTNTTFQQSPAALDNDDFHVTVIEEKNSKQRNGLLLAATILMVGVVSVSTVYSLFDRELGVGAIGDEGLFSMVVVDDAPMEVELPEEKKIGDEGGGGGGGGRNDNEPVGKGTIPPQLKERFLTPSNEDISVSNPAIKVTRATKGPNDIIPTNRSTVNGDPNSTNPNRSSGLGPDNLGMGQNGSGGFGNNGRDGQGSNGDGGIGNAPGGNYGNNPGGPGGVRPPPSAPTAPPKPAGVTQKYKIIAKPRADYTDLARQNQVTGTVTVKVTFLSSGQVGSVVPVNGLPYGLTEKAIAAAKAIKFEPAKRDGVPYTITATVQYNFNIY